MLHWLILVPYYFVGSLTALPLLILICRLARLKASINALVGTAIGIAVAGIVMPLAGHCVDRRALSGRPMLVLIVLSFAFAAADAALAGRLPLPLDKELQEL